MSASDLRAQLAAAEKRANYWQDAAAGFLSDRECWIAKHVELERELAEARSWHGLMAFLDEHYPAEVFDGCSDDEGPRIVALVRALHRAEASRRDWAAEAARLQHFIDTALFPDLQPDFHTVRVALPPIVPTACACVTDDQATQLGPGFTRPVCAVHPVEESA